ncbi:TonB-dependent receptor [Snuella sedimenti]|uniref:TonB-dependent receptor n=1 Tax=Snuella sedimenti TaxID=2798802 RepID=A0A8J7J499_9FLAO|nr:TonB-dependent receptor [Snuella sedimenti]MBJ6369607.1 TonB-dependent receptor [Snuella sedimenti]
MNKIISAPANSCKNSIGYYLIIAMRAFLLFICIGLSSAYANHSYAQTKINVNVKEITFEELFKVIQSESKYVFFYKDSDLNIGKKVTLNIQNAPLESILNTVFKGTNLNFKIKNRQVVIKNEGKNKSKVDEKLLKRQNYVIKGYVTDKKGVPLIGANILEKGTKNGIQADFDGNFELTVSSGNSTLVISYLGYLSQEIAIQERERINIILEEDLEQLGEVVLVGYGTQKKESVVSAITTVKPADLKIPSSNLTASFSGVIPGLISFQTSGEPGADNAAFFIRGVTTFGYANSPLILIDGMESTTDDLARIDVDDIADFSIMKDATSAALYGSRGANGVILINTKDGVKGKAKVSFKFENYASSNVTDIEFADPVTYMILNNEAVQTRRGLSNQSTVALPFTQNQIDAVASGTNKNVFPAVDWRDKLFKDKAVNQRLNLNVSGGGDVAKYYLSVTYTRDTGILKIDDRNDYNTGIKLNKFQIRSNNILNITKTLEARVQTYIAVDDYTGPLGGASSLFKKVANASPVLFPAYYEPDQANLYNPNILFGNFDDGSYINPYTESIKGYRDYTRSKLNAQINLKQKITEEISLRAKIGYDRNSYFELNRQMTPAFYNIGSYDELSDVYTLKFLNEESNPENVLSFVGSPSNVSTVFYGEFAANYNKTFLDIHDFTAMLVSTIRESADNTATDLQSSLPKRNLSLAGRFSYALKSKYFLEFVFGYNGSERFAKKERFGYFPSLGFGWDISKENFWKNIKPIVNKFKITSTYGLVGNDNIGSASDRFFYLSLVNLSANGRSATFGENYGYNLNGVDITRYENSDITWETAKKFNLGLQLGLFKNKIEINADYFSEKRENIFTQRAAVPSSLGLTADIFANSGAAKSQGVEFSLKLRENWGKNWWIQGTGNFTYAKGVYTQFDEPDYSSTPWLSVIGNRINQAYGYVVERLFVDESDVANSPAQFGEPNIAYTAGDIKYKDINNDGKINTQDVVPIGNSLSPEINYGFGFSLGYKNLDFNCFFNGLANRTIFIDSDETAPFRNTSIDDQTGVRNLLKTYADDHWSEENRNIYALWPRLSDQTIQNNNQRSTWFMRDGSLLRLKSVEIGYTLDKLFGDKMFENVRFYLSGTNLFTLSKFDLWDVELGGNAFTYPIQKVYNFGLRANF